MDDLVNLLFESHPQPMWIYDRETLAFLVVNNAAIATYGYSREEFLAMTLKDIRPPADVVALTASLGEFAGGFRDVPGTFRHRRRDGSVFPVAIRAHELIHDGRPSMLVAVHDASETVALKARLKADAALMRLAGKAARFGGWRVDIDTGRVQWSDETAAIHDEPAGHSPTVETGIAYYAPEHRDRISTVFRACAKRGEPYDEVLQILTATGRRVWVRTLGEAERNAEGRIVAVRGAFQDISDLMAARKEADRSAARLKHTIESISDCLYTLDHEWRFTSVNPQAEVVLRRSADELIGATVWTAYPEIVGTILESHYRRAAAAGRACRFDFLYPPLETWFEVSVYPSADGLTIFFSDINEKKRAEGLLAWQAAMLDDAQEAITVRDLSHRILYWNRMAEKLFGWRAEDVVGRGAFEVLGVDADRVRMAEAATLEQGRWVGRLEKRRKNGSTVTVESRWSRIAAKDDRPAAILVMDADITDRLVMEAKLAQLNRLDAVGQLTGGVAHDFNNLLTVILGNADLMAEFLPEGDPLCEMVGMSRMAAERGAELTRRLLAFARRQPLDPRPTDVNRLVADLAPLARRTLGEDIDLEIVHAAGLWPAEIDPAEMENAILNLCLNARDAMRAKGGGKLTIETANAALDEAYARAHDEVRPGRYVMVAVSDTGEGMTADVLARVFEPFFTTKGVGKGSGLGLSQVFGFARQSKGHVKVYSEPGEGTTVRLYAPRASCAVDDPPLQEAASTPRGSETVLLVEDDPLVRAHAATLLRALGYSPIEAEDGPAALAFVEAGAPFDILFTDVVMPGGMSGRDLADAVLRHRPDVAILFTSGYTENAIVHHGRLDPGVLLLAKPYRRQQLAEKLREALALRRRGATPQRTP